MSAAHEQNYHHPVNHNERVKSLIRKFNVKLQGAHGERGEILAREDEGEKLCFADKARSSDLYLQISDISRTLEQLDSLILPEEN
jgi:hypothetical protein